MANTGSFAITIAAVDQATSKIDKINKSLAQLHAPVDKLQKSLTKFGDLSGVSRAFETVRRTIHGALGVLGKFVPLLAGLTAGSLVVALARAIDKWSSFAQTLQITSKWLGMVPGQLMTLQNSFRIVGGSADGMNRTLQSVGDTIQDALVGRNIPALILMNKIFGKDLPKSAEAAMPRIAEAIRKFHGSPASARLFAHMLGIDDPAMFAQFRAKGAAAWSEMQSRAAQFSLNDNEISGLARFREIIVSITLAVERFASRIAAGLSTNADFLAMVERFQAWLSDPARAERWVKRIVQVLSDLASFVNNTLFPLVHKLGGPFRGWERAIEILIALPLLGWLTALITPLVAVVGLFTSGAGALTAFAGGLAGLAKGGVIGLLADQILKLVDPMDRVGAWIDKHIPGASRVDNFFSHVGMGRSYAQQKEAEEHLHPGPGPVPGAIGGTGWGTGAHSEPLTPPRRFTPPAPPPHPSFLKAMMGVPPASTGDTRTALNAAMTSAGITSPETRAGLAAIVQGESGFKPRSEVSYSHTSNARLRQVFGRLRGLSDAELTALKGNDEAFYNRIYGGRLGNAADEGYKFRGRGLIQLTGKDNYIRYGKMIGVDLVSHPELANRPDIAARLAVAYIQSRYHGGGGFGAMEHAVNPGATAGMNAQKERAYQQFLRSREFAAAVPTSAPASAKMSGRVAIDIVHRNPPDGARVTASSHGDYLAPPTVRTPMTGYAMPA